ncbi:MAG TPA: ABC transporter permease subunit [Candidatus Limiplasma sp.]|nr:ABC transporter permease subunit [Candidatus Limiplasma sp.]
MKTFYAFFKKEQLEMLRTGRLLVLIILFALFGIMNPAIAKLTPWMLQSLSGSMAESGIIITNIAVNALTSWTQFYKNLPIALLIFVLMTSAIFTAEYQKGTLVLVLTKGLKRTKILAAKALTLLVVWTGLYYLCYFITLGYTAFYWDNGIAQHVGLAAGLYLLFGIWVLSVMVLCSAPASANTGVLLGTGGAVLAVYLLGLLPNVAPYLPLYLTQSMSLLTGTLAPGAMARAAGVTVGLIAANTAAAVLLFQKRSL